MKPAQTGIQIIEHALDNHVHAQDYRLHSVLAKAQTYTHAKPQPCAILPRQFGYWFHIGPGFAPLEGQTYRHQLLTASHVRILGQDGVPVFSGNWVDSTTLHYCRPDRSSCQFRREQDVLYSQPTSRRLEGCYFLGFNAGHENYAHWLSDQVPLLWHYKTVLMEEGIGLLLPRNHARFVQFYLEAMAIPPSCITYIGDEVVEIEELIFATFFSFDAIPFSITQLLTDFKGSLPTPSAKRRRGIFISRRETHIRSLLNEEALCRHMVKAGFEIIVPAEMSVAAQIQTFREADVVIGCHGAGLANIVFCEPGTRVLELFPEYTVSAHFWMLAGLFGLNYGVLFGTSFDQDRALQDQSGSWDASFVISEDALMQYLNTLPGH